MSMDASPGIRAPGCYVAHWPWRVSLASRTGLRQLERDVTFAGSLRAARPRESAGRGAGARIFAQTARSTGDNGAVGVVAGTRQKTRKASNIDLLCRWKKPMKLIDLHTHSLASDGTDSPSALVEKAHAAGLAALAVTDHDTLSGLEEAEATGRSLGISVIRGCELSTGTEHGEMHILGLWLPREAKPLQERLVFLRRKRAERNALIVEKLRGLGLAISMDDVREAARGESVGRPHIADVLLRKGYAKDSRQAFQEYLGSRGKAFVPKEVLEPEAAVRLLAGWEPRSAWPTPCSRNIPAAGWKVLRDGWPDMGSRLLKPGTASTPKPTCAPVSPWPDASAWESAAVRTITAATSRASVWAWGAAACGLAWTCWKILRLRDVRKACLVRTDCLGKAPAARGGVDAAEAARGKLPGLYRQTTLASYGNRRQREAGFSAD